MISKKLKLSSLLVAGMFICSSCGGSQRVDMSKWTFTPKNENMINIGILLPVEHNALESAKNGFIDELASKGYTVGDNISINYKNANGSDSDLNIFAKDLISSCDITLGVGTSSAQSLYSQSVNLGIYNPILFTAVTDAVSGQLVDSNENPGQYVTGTSDDNPVEAQISLIKEALPEAQNVGIFYTQSEINSKIQADKAAAKISELGMNPVIKTCMGTTDLVANIQSLASQVDAIYIPTDNNCASNMNSIAANSGNKLLLVGEENLLTSGGHLTLSVDYTNLGKKTADIAVDIITKVKKPNEIAVETMSEAECVLKYSSNNCASSSISLPQSILDRATNIDE